MRTTATLLTAALTLGSTITAAPAAHATPTSKQQTVQTAKRTKLDSTTHQKVQRHLKRLGFRTTVANGQDTPEFRNILCAWREINGQKQHQGRLKAAEADTILNTTALPAPPDSMVTGLNVNLQCQSVYIVQKVNKKERQYVKVFRASTGGINGLTTSTGNFTIQRRIDGLHNSTGYPSASGWNMYRPAYFTSWGEAFHGSPSDATVYPYPATHGCVRLVQRDIDYLWRHGYNTVGTNVHIYGEWRW